MHTNTDTKFKWEFKFPSSVNAGSLLNKFLESFFGTDMETGFSNFDKHISAISKKVEIVSKHQTATSKKYTLAKDIWGTKELFLYLEDENDVDFILSHVSRSGTDFQTLLEYVRSNDNFELTENEGIYVAYSFVQPNLYWAMIRELVIVFKKINSQDHDITVMINLLFPLRELR